jgi:hypothetical protein
VNQTIEIRISPRGEVVVDTQGFRGASCREASRFLIQALGTKASEQTKPEFYQQESSKSQLKQRG